MESNTVIKFKVVHYHRINLSELVYPGMEEHILIVRVSDLPSDVTKQANLRLQNIRKKLYRGVRKTLEDKHSKFFYTYNNGLKIHSRACKYDDSTGMVTIHLDDPKIPMGIADGGHTYEIIKESIKDGKCPEQYIKITVFANFPTKEIAVRTTAGNNTSTAVKKQSIFNQLGYFDWMKKYFVGKQISWMENGEGFPIRTMVSIFSAFNIENYPNKRRVIDEITHPIICYNSKGKVLDGYEFDKSLKKLSLVLKDIMYLYSYIMYKTPTLYNEGGGRFGSLEHINAPVKQYDLVFLEKNIKLSLTLNGAICFPILSAFRSFLVERDGKFVWSKPFSYILRVCDENLLVMFGKILDKVKLSDTKHICSTISSDISLWGELYNKIRFNE